jgi:phage-related protein
MNATVVAALLQAILSLLQNFGVNSQAVSTVISTLIAIVPFLTKELEDIKPAIQQIIELVTGSADVTPDQLTQIEALSAQVDAAFDSAVTSYEASHPDAG